MTLNRRRFVQSLAIAAVSPAIAMSERAESSPLGELRPDPDRIIDLPSGFSYRIVSRAGDLMSDGLRVPHAHDGMAAFEGKDGRVVLVCNHELGPEDGRQNAFGTDRDAVPSFVRERIYDAGEGVTPGNGGTSTTIFDPASGKTERQHLSLVGTEYNCSGGATPWGSWLSCEESFRNPGYQGAYRREKAHGYVFEVPATTTGLVEPQPIKAMGRFEHEAAAVHAASGIVFMTEDRNDSLFYRFIPHQPGKLLAGGRLQALAVGDDDSESVNTSNWHGKITVNLNEQVAVRWIDLDAVESGRNDLHLRGAAKGATTFTRGEGMCVSGDDLFFAATTGGPASLGQIFRYRASAHEGEVREMDAPGSLTLIAESNVDSLLRNADNLTMAPNGDLMVCEDTASKCGIVGIGPDGVQYEIADNPYTGSELAGICFSPDGATLFVNIQYPGMTLAITGPWPVGGPSGPISNRG
jgi:secreted PhoX family phosphatase